MIKAHYNASTLPWCIIRDFNNLLSPDDKRGCAEHPNWLLCGFRKVVSDFDLNNLPIQCYSFMWERCKGTDQAMEERLDRALVSLSWLSIFKHLLQTNLVAPMLDHSLIMLQTKEEDLK